MKIANYIYRVFIGTAKSFLVHDCFYKASALTFYTLLSIVPILAIAFGIAKGFGFEKYLEKEVTSRFLDQPLLAEKITDFAYSVLIRTHGGVIAGIGVISLLWTSLQLFSNIEYSLNAIWEVKQHRSYARQFTDYLAMLILCPIFLVISSSISFYTTTQLNLASQKYSMVLLLSPYLLFGFRVFPLIINWLLFSFIYIFIPNTKVRWKTALIAGLIAGTSYQIVQWIYIHFQIGVANYGAIYGSFAALPLFLAWVNLSWVIVLAGAELEYQLEITSIEPIGATRLASKGQIGFWIACHCTERFLQSMPPVGSEELAKELGSSVHIIRLISLELCRAGILIENKNNCFALGKNPEEIKVDDILKALDEMRVEKFTIKSGPDFSNYNAALLRLENFMKNSSDNISLYEVASRIESANQQKQEQPLQG